MKKTLAYIIKGVDVDGTPSTFLKSVTVEFPQGFAKQQKFELDTEPHMLHTEVFYYIHCK